MIGAQGAFLQVNSSLLPIWSTSPTLGKNGTTTGQLGFANGGTSGATVTIQNNAATTGYNFNLPGSAGTSGQPLLSGGGVLAAMTFGTLSSGAGGTGQTSLTSHGVLIGAGASPISQLSAAALGTLLTGQGASTDPSFSPTPTLGVNAVTTGTLGLANGGGSGATVTVRNSVATSGYNFNLPGSAGSSGQPLLSGGGGSSAMTYGSVTGNDNTNIFVSANTNFTPSNVGQEVTIDSHGDAQASAIIPNTTWTAGQNYLWFPSLGQPGNTGGAANFGSINFLIFNAPYKMIVNRMSVFVSTASNGKNFVVGIYDVTGTTLLGQATVPCGNTGSRAATVATSGTITLQPGTPYMVGWINDDATCTVAAQVTSGWFAILNANTVKRMGTTTGSFSLDTMPAPIVTLTASTAGMLPYILLEP